LDRLQSEQRALSERLQAAEQKLNEVPSDILIQLQRIIAVYSRDELGRALAARADFIGRMQSFLRASAKPINLRAFTRQGGNLYAVAKAPSAALEHVRPGDPFLLVRKAPTGLETPSARLLVHQPPEPGKDVVMFSIAEFLADEMGHIDSLARTGDVAGLKGYGIKFDCDLAGYGDLNLQSIAGGITRLVRDITGEPGSAS
jgi:hypothetical protein